MPGSSWDPYNPGCSQLPYSRCLHDHRAHSVSVPSAPVPSCPVLLLFCNQVFPPSPFPMLPGPAHPGSSQDLRASCSGLLLSNAPKDSQFFPYPPLLPDPPSPVPPGVLGSLLTSFLSYARFSRFPGLPQCPLSPDESPCLASARCCPVPRSSSSPPHAVPPPPGKRKRGGRKPSFPRRAGPGPRRDRDGTTSLRGHHGNFHRQLLATELASRRPQR